MRSITTASKLIIVKLIAILIAAINVSVVNAQRDLPPVYGGTPISYVRTWSVIKPVSNPADLTVTTGLQTAKMTTQYLDGLGRPIQTVLKQGSMVTGQSPVDLISMVTYDELGRERFNYLATPANNTNGNVNINNGLFKTNPFQQQQSFYNTYLAGQAGEKTGDNKNWAYGQFDYEPSPLNRPIEQFAPGVSWVGTAAAPSAGDRKSGKTKYLTNTGDDDVRQWNVDIGAFGTFSSYNSPGEYTAGLLYKSITENEQGKQQIEFKDKEGKVILKKSQLTAAADNGAGAGHAGWLCTYYLYDHMNNLRCVIQPEGVKAIQSNWLLTNATILKEQCFRYEYDHRTRVVMKQVPGTEPEYKIYDARDRMVFLQDGNLRTNNEWLATLYDALNRPVLTGKITYTGTFSALQSHVTTATATPASPVPGLAVDKVLTNNNATGTERALRSIIMEDGFETGTSPDFIAEIVNEAGGPDGETSVVAGIPVYKNPLPGPDFYLLTATFYDNYEWLQHQSSPFTASRDNVHDSYLETGTSTYPYPQAAIQSGETKGLVTGAKTRVLNSEQFLLGISYYDDKLRVVQTKATNITGGVDIFTTQYSWAGQPVVTVQKLNAVGEGAQTTEIATRQTYDDLGRVLSTQKRQRNTLVDNNNLTAYKTIATNEYDALGKLKTKQLAPYFKDNAGLEKQEFDYNIRGWLLGSNRSALVANGNSSGPYFAFDLAYDKKVTAYGRDYTNNQADGNIAGMLWKSKGDGIRRKYDFQYDATSRLLKGNFEQNDGTSVWGSSLVNYKVVMGDENNEAATAYNANGNILKMQQWGLTIGGSIQIDHLKYTYQTESNKLKSVVDFNNDPTTGLGDFRTATSHDQISAKTALNSSSSPSAFDAIQDYDYDQNGNLRYDKNKGIISITYNSLNLPHVITTTKGTITYVHDAGGNKIRKTTQETNASVQYNGTHTSNITTVTTYLGATVFESKLYSNPALAALNQPNKLQFVGMQEGRIRVKTKNEATSFVYDYMLKDHLGNVRMLLTDDENTEKVYPMASLEPAKLATEKDYYTIDEARIVPKTDASGMVDYVNDNGIGNNPADPVFESANSAYVYKLNRNTNKIGLGITLKVMAGDKIDIYGRSYWNTPNSGGEPVNVAPAVLDLLNSLLGSPSGVAAGGHTGNTMDAIPSIKNPLGGFITDGDRPDPINTTRPKAFINYIFLDEQFLMQKGGFSAVKPTAGMRSDHIEDLQGLTAEKNGYVYIYVSNESPVDVFFDNLQVVHKPGQILEETHYYPFGLTMAGISGRALVAGEPENKNKFGGKELNNKEFVDGAGLETYDFGARTYDQQIGRWQNPDPMSMGRTQFTPYNSMRNNPVNNADPSGAFDWVQTATEMFYDTRVTNQKDATALYGKDAIHRANGYTYKSGSDNIELGDHGFFKENGKILMSEDRAEKSLAYLHPEMLAQQTETEISAVQASFAFALAIRTGQAADVATPDPTDVLPWKWIGHAALFIGTTYYLNKMAKEIEGILRRSGSTQGYMYSLTANVSGNYPELTWGDRSNSTTPLNPGDVWKYGETSSARDRYSMAEKAAIGPGGVTENPIFYGNQIQIKVAEKVAIYSYFLANGHLPPGNKIFR